MGTGCGPSPFPCPDEWLAPSAERSLRQELVQGATRGSADEHQQLSEQDLADHGRRVHQRVAERDPVVEAGAGVGEGEQGRLGLGAGQLTGELDPVGAL